MSWRCRRCLSELRDVCLCHAPPLRKCRWLALWLIRARARHEHGSISRTKRKKTKHSWLNTRKHPLFLRGSLVQRKVSTTSLFVQAVTDVKLPSQCPSTGSFHFTSSSSSCPSRFTTQCAGKDYPRRHVSVFLSFKIRHWFNLPYIYMYWNLQALLNWYKHLPLNQCKWAIYTQVRHYSN